ncbi:uncharacterized protein Tco025E_01292 [Trypanosoma conorhini]|uniref:Uncharacterized protein n=1 Tax=Trypanosoma conorhini TaxID=83891 RepID=A0A3R7M4Q4_9TRYP|nr:uncharacterized protein Tco025E_01292 [Trypanosoma conorhini]RNF26519.1 hypothetical protein Tco025E_01292 [Trypanosoma conorhini]
MLAVGTTAGRDTVFGGGSGTGAVEATKDVFAHLYRDAASRRQRQAEAGRPCHSDTAPVAPHPFEGNVFSQGRNRAARDAGVVRRGSEEVVTRPGATKFQTNKRLDSLALPRGPCNTAVHPPSPNYGRVLSFTEEEARSRRGCDSLRPRALSRPPRLTIPLNNPTLNRLATPRAAPRLALASKYDSDSCGARRPATLTRQGSRIFRF